MRTFPDRIDAYDDQTAWKAPHAHSPAAEFVSGISTDWLADSEAALSVDHDDTRIVLVTNRSVTPTLTGEFSHDVAAREILMGYTDLSVCEKRAVVVDGMPLRVWAKRRSAANAQPVARLALIREDSGTPLGISLPQYPWHGMQQALRLSALMPGRPVLVVGVLESHFWH